MLILICHFVYCYFSLNTSSFERENRSYRKIKRTEWEYNQMIFGRRFFTDIHKIQLKCIQLFWKMKCNWSKGTHIVLKSVITEIVTEMNVTIYANQKKFNILFNLWYMSFFHKMIRIYFLLWRNEMKRKENNRKT